VLIVHGTGDDKLGVHLARWARAQLERFPLALTYRELPIGHAITPESLAVVAAWLSASLDRHPVTAPAAPPAPHGA
jgi:predicted esterase